MVFSYSYKTRLITICDSKDFLSTFTRYSILFFTESEKCPFGNPPITMQDSSVNFFPTSSQELRTP